MSGTVTPSLVPQARGALAIEGAMARYNHREGNDDFSQPRALFELMSPEQRERLFGNIARHMQGVPDFIKERQLGHFEKCHPEYAAGVREAIARVGD